MLESLLARTNAFISRTKKNIKFNSIKYSGLIKSAGAMFAVLYGPQVLTANTSFSVGKAQTEQNEAEPTNFNPSNPEYNIDGMVLDSQQQPVKDMPLYLINFQNGEPADTLAQTVSSLSGGFDFVNLPNSINPPEVIPTAFSVSENYPNPVRTNTALDIEVVTPGNYTLTKVNSIGQIVSRTTFSQVPAGVHQINMDVRGLASGAYFYKIIGPDEQKTGSMIVVNNNVVGGSSPGVVLNQGSGDKNNINQTTSFSSRNSTSTLSDDYDLRITTPKTSQFEGSQTPVNVGSDLQIVQINLENLIAQYMISGQVINTDSEPLSDYELRIKNSSNDLIASVFTDENGLYSFDFETSNTNLSLKKPETEFYEEQIIPLNLQPGTNFLDVEALDKYVFSIISGEVFNTRDESLLNVLVNSDYGSATTNSQGNFVLELEHEKRKQDEAVTISFSKNDYHPKQVQTNLQNQTLDAVLDVVLQENSFVLTNLTVNGDAINPSLMLKYTNEFGEEVNLDLASQNNQTNVNYQGWPGENAVLVVTDENYLNLPIGTKVNQSITDLNLFQANHINEETVLPIQELNSLGEAVTYFIPSTGQRTVLQNGEPITQEVDMDWLLHETVNARAATPAGNIKWYLDQNQGEELRFPILNFQFNNGSEPTPEAVENANNIAESILEAYTLNNGTVLLNYDKRIVDSESDPWLQQILEDQGENSMYVWFRPGTPGNGNFYQQVDVNGTEYNFLRSASAGLPNGASNNSIIEEIFEGLSASDEPSTAQRWYRSQEEPGNENIYFNDIGKTLLRTITLSNPGTQYLESGSTSSSQTTNQNRNVLQDNKIEDAVILEETNYN